MGVCASRFPGLIVYFRYICFIWGDGPRSILGVVGWNRWWGGIGGRRPMGVCASRFPGLIVCFRYICFIWGDGAVRQGLGGLS